jgi:hypothetical protein
MVFKRMASSMACATASTTTATDSCHDGVSSTQHGPECLRPIHAAHGRIYKPPLSSRHEPSTTPWLRSNLLAETHICALHKRLQLKGSFFVHIDYSRLRLTKLHSQVEWLGND